MVQVVVMPTDRQALEIGERFRSEREYIERYVHLLRVKSTIHDRQVLDLNRILTRVQIKPLPIRHYDRAGQPYSPKEIKTLFDAIAEAGPELYQTILGHEQRLDAIPSFLLNSPAADYMDRLFEWVDYLVAHLSDDPEDDEVKTLLRSAMEEAQTVEEQFDEEDRIPADALKDLLNIAVEHALHAKVKQRVDEMVYAREQFQEIELLTRMAAPDAEISVLRQGFLLLMTTFDAAVFDLTRIAFRRKFFDVIGVFGKHDKVSLEELAEAGSFENFRDRTIEQQLKKRYVKDLLNLLSSAGISCVDNAAGDHLVQLIEVVLRRNLHVHNRGIVDDRYLEPDPRTGNAKYNLYDLGSGNLAPIDDEYFHISLRICGNCVDRLVAWCES